MTDAGRERRGGLQGKDTPPIGGCADGVRGFFDTSEEANVTGNSSKGQKLVFYSSF